MATANKDIWDKLSTVSPFLASVLVPIVLALAGHWYASAVKEAENRVRYTELAVEILKSEPSKQQSHIRGWAVDVLQRYSGVPISEQTRSELIDRSILERADVLLGSMWLPAYTQRFVREIQANPSWATALAAKDQKLIAELTESTTKKIVQQTIRTRSAFDDDIRPKPPIAPEIQDIFNKVLRSHDSASSPQR